MGRNRGFIHPDTNHDASELARARIVQWRHDHGRRTCVSAEGLLVFCEGDSNGASCYVFMDAMQALTNRLGIEIRVAQYPPYRAMYNPIEHHHSRM